MKKLRVLDLFSGIGGFSLGLERTGGFETVAFCEIEEFPRKVLAKHWPDVPRFSDVRKLTRADIDGPVDVICGGYPCQPFSTAGRRLGKEDDRHLWPEFARLVEEFRPTWVIGENVAGHISMGLDDVLSDLERLGYTARPFVIPACAVDAQHRRDRVWTVAHSYGWDDQSGAGNRPRIRSEAVGKRANDDACCASVEQEIMADPSQLQSNERTDYAAELMGGKPHWSGQPRNGNWSNDVANANDTRLQGRQEARHPESIGPWRDKLAERCSNGERTTWEPEPAVGRVANGVPSRVDRLKALGNAVVPQVVQIIGAAILEAERNAAA